MKEFGSDFHFIDSFQNEGTHLSDIFPNAYYLADGRMCLMALIEQNQWKRIWMPEYFCYEVIESILKHADVEILFYPDFPGNNDLEVIDNIKFRDGDVLFRVNYFGMREKRSEITLPVPVVEDHTHDLIGPWALHSDADWCIASLRKTLPVPEGGILWSPKGNTFSFQLKDTNENESNAAKRWEAMDKKARYLNDELMDKCSFRSLFLETEDWFENASISTLDKRTISFLNNFDIIRWYQGKRENLHIIEQLTHNGIEAESPSCNIFSFVLRVDNRDDVRKSLIDKQIYPAILWNVPYYSSSEVRCFSERMLSVHCDGRYSKAEIAEMAERVMEVI